MGCWPELGLGGIQATATRPAPPTPPAFTVCVFLTKITSLSLGILVFKHAFPHPCCEPTMWKCFAHFKAWYKTMSCHAIMLLFFHHGLVIRAGNAQDYDVTKCCLPFSFSAFQWNDLLFLQPPWALDHMNTPSGFPRKRNPTTIFCLCLRCPLSLVAGAWE